MKNVFIIKQFRLFRQLIPMVSSVILVLTSSTVMSADDSKAQVKGPSQSVSGMTVNIDPKTGEFLETPPAGIVSPSAKSSAVAPKFEVIESPNPEEGVKVNVQSYFQKPLKATTGPDGKPIISHDEAP